MNTPSRLPKLAVASRSEAVQTALVPLNFDQIVEEISQWPEDIVARLVDHIMLARRGGIAPGVETAWDDELRRRMEEIRSGKVQGIPGEEVSARLRKIVGR